MTDPATTTPTDPAAPAATPAAPAAPAGHGIAWLPADADADLVGHVQNKAWGSPVDAVKGARELEKLLGADRAGRTVTVPKDDAPAEEWAKFHDRLGRPGAPEQYKLAVPEGMPAEFAKAAAAKFHELGLTARQAEALSKWWNDTGTQQTAAQEAAMQATLEAEHKALEKDWGTGPDASARRELARRAAVHLGLDEAAIDGIERTAGYAKTLKALAKVGDMLREGGIEGAGEVGTFGNTPEGAKAKRAQLMADKEWVKRAMVPNSREWAELQKLDGIIVASMSNA